MWIITNVGFFSVVEKPGQRATGKLTVRSRIRKDLETLRDKYLPALGEIRADEGTDYRYRAVASKGDVAEAVRKAVADIDYSNFKNSVASRQGQQRADAYHDVWEVLWQLKDEA